MHSLGIHYYPLTLPFLLVLLGGLVALTFLALLRVLQFAYSQLGIAPDTSSPGFFSPSPGATSTCPSCASPGADNPPGGNSVLRRSLRDPDRGDLAGDHPGGERRRSDHSDPAVGDSDREEQSLPQRGLGHRGRLPRLLSARRAGAGLGIAIPVFYPPVIAAIVALLLSRRFAAPLAYVCGSLGTLIGADLMNLGNFRGLGAPVVSIGGAGPSTGYRHRALGGRPRRHPQPAAARSRREAEPVTSPASFDARLRALSPALLKGLKRGIEKESLRVRPTARSP